MMYAITKDIKYAQDGYGTLKAFFRYFSYNFYPIGLPVILSYESMKLAGMKEEWQKLEQDYINLSETYIENGFRYPKFEVNYEQSIVASFLQVL